MLYIKYSINKKGLFNDSLTNPFLSYPLNAGWIL